MELILRSNIVRFADTDEGINKYVKHTHILCILTLQLFLKQYQKRIFKIQEIRTLLLHN